MHFFFYWAAHGEGVNPLPSPLPQQIRYCLVLTFGWSYKVETEIGLNAVLSPLIKTLPLVENCFSCRAWYEVMHNPLAASWSLPSSSRASLMRLVLQRYTFGYSLLYRIHIKSHENQGTVTVSWTETTWRISGDYWLRTPLILTMSH